MLIDDFGVERSRASRMFFGDLKKYAWVVSLMREREKESCTGSLFNICFTIFLDFSIKKF